MRAREPQRQLVGLAPGVDEVADGKRFRQRRAQPLREVPDRVVQVSRVGVQRAHLIHRGLHDPWMRVPDVRNVVVGVKVLRAAVVEQVLHPAAGELHRVGVRETEIRAEPPLPLRQGGGLRLQLVIRTHRSAAGGVEGLFSNVWMNRRQHRERPLDRRLADRQILIVRTLPLLICRDANADT